MRRLLLLCLALLAGSCAGSDRAADADARWPGQSEPGSKFVPVRTEIEGWEVIVGVFPTMSLEDGTLVRPVFLSAEQANGGSCRTFGISPVKYAMGIACGVNDSPVFVVAPRSGLTWREVGGKSDVTVLVDRGTQETPDR